MTKNPTPKALFLADSVAVKNHNAMVDTDTFQKGTDTAILCYVRALCDVASGDMSSERYEQASACAFNRIQGMMDFVALVRNLGIVPPPPKKQADMNLTEPEPTN